MEKDMKLRKFIATTIREYLNEQKMLNEEKFIEETMRDQPIANHRNPFGMWS